MDINDRLTDKSVDGDAKSRYSVNGRENIVQSIKALEITDWGSRGPDDTTEHESDLRRNRRQETGLNAEESAVFAKSLSQRTEIETARFKGDSRRKSEVHPSPKTTLTSFSQPRRKSTSEVGRHRCSGKSNLKLTLAVAWRNDEHMCNETSSPLTTTKRVICDNERVEETLEFRAMSRENISEKLQLSFAGPTLHRKESNGDRLRSEHRRINTHTERMQDKGLLDRPFSTQKLRLPTPEQGESTRIRSLSGSHLEDSFMSAKQREKLDRLKRQIYDANSKRKNCKKVSGSRSDEAFNGGKFQQNTGYSVADGSTLPVLTEKSLKRHSKSHERVIWAAPESPSATTAGHVIYTDTSARSNVSDTVSNPNSYVDLAGHMEETDFDTSLNTESSELPLMPSTLAYSADNEQVKRESNRFHFPPPTSEEGDPSESITVIIERLRARSEPGDVGSRKVSTVKHGQSRTRSDSDALKVKVQSFVEKPLPALPPATLRVKKYLNGVPAKSGYFKSGANANIAPEMNERKEGVINIHTCPTLNLFSDQSWMYQDKSQRKHRYIRGPATPVPPLDFVFRKGNPDIS